MDVERELTRVLRTVDVPPVPDPVTAVRAGMRHRQRVRRVQAATAAVAVVGIAVGASVVLGDDPGRTRITPVPGASTAAPAPSQTADDAARDGVVPAVAALPFRARVAIVTSEVTPEGVWALSRMPLESGDPASGGVGTPGAYGRTFVSAAEYGEVLLLDPTRSRILRAFPLPGLPPQRLLVTDAAVYCERQGDGALPDSMLCRIDRQTLSWKARIFPSTLDSGFAPPSPDRFLPANWLISAPLGVAVFQTLQFQGGELLVAGDRASGRIDPLTLELALTRHSLQPAAGICAEAAGSVVSFRTSPDNVPVPRCSYARLDQSLQVENTLDTSVTAVLSTGQRVVVPPHETRAFPGKLRDLVQVAGSYTVDLGPARAELLVEG
jgi:hypothetical protein